MSGGYVFIVGILLYFLLLRRMDASSMSPIKAAAILILGYYALRTIILAVEYWLRGEPILSNVLDPMLVVTAAVQYISSIGIFYKVSESGDEYLSYAFWGGAGLALIFFIVPSVVQGMTAAL